MADDFRTTEVGERYAQALFDLADETGVLDAVRADLASLRAAVQPEKSEFLYFVARGDGSSEFSTTLADHNRAVNKFIRNGGGR